MDDFAARQSLIWMAVLLGTAILFSFALACGMPFAAIGALAALTLSTRDAVFFVGLGWFANQAIGFGFLGYPFDVMTLAWGVALGLSALAAVGAAVLVRQRNKGATMALQFGATFLAAWAAQQAIVFAATLVLGGTLTAFAPAVVWFIFWTNALAFIVLLSAQFVGARAGVARLPLAQGTG